MIKLLKKSETFLKYKKWGSPHKRIVFYLNKGKTHGDGCLFWVVPQHPIGKPGDKYFRINDITQISTGKNTPLLQKSLTSVPASHCFSVSSKTHTIELQANSESICIKWVTALRLLVKYKAKPEHFDIERSTNNNNSDKKSSFMNSVIIKPAFRPTGRRAPPQSPSRIVLTPKSQTPMTPNTPLTPNISVNDIDVANESPDTDQLVRSSSFISTSSDTSKKIKKHGDKLPKRDILETRAHLEMIFEEEVEKMKKREQARLALVKRREKILAQQEAFALNETQKAQKILKEERVRSVEMITKARRVASIMTHSDNEVSDDTNSGLRRRITSVRGPLRRDVTMSVREAYMNQQLQSVVDNERKNKESSKQNNQTDKDLPLLEELGIDIHLVFLRARASLLRGQIFLPQSDAVGPVILLLLLAFLALLFHGILRFGVLFRAALFTFSSVLVLIALLPTSLPTNIPSLSIIASTLGYGLVVFPFYSIIVSIFNLDGFFLLLIAGATVYYATTSTCYFLLENKNYNLIFLPVLLCYSLFALLVVS